MRHKEPHAFSLRTDACPFGERDKEKLWWCRELRRSSSSAAAAPEDGDGDCRQLCKAECWFLDGCREGYCLLSIFSCLLSLLRLPYLGEAIEDLNGFYTKIKHSEVVCGLLVDMDLVFSPLPFTSCNLLLFFSSSNKGRLLASGSACNCNCKLEVQIFLVCNLEVWFVVWMGFSFSVIEVWAFLSNAVSPLGLAGFELGYGLARKPPPPLLGPFLPI